MLAVASTQTKLLPLPVWIIIATRMPALNAFCSIQNAICRLRMLFFCSVCTDDKTYSKLNRSRFNYSHLDLPQKAFSMQGKQTHITQSETSSPFTLKSWSFTNFVKITTFEKIESVSNQIRVGLNIFAGISPKRKMSMVNSK